MRNLRRFNSVSEMNTALASSEIDIIGLAFDDSGKPVIKNKQGSSPVPPYTNRN